MISSPRCHAYVTQYHEQSTRGITGTSLTYWTIQTQISLINRTQKFDHHSYMNQYIVDFHWEKIQINSIDMNT